MKSVNEWGREYRIKLTFAELIEAVRNEYEEAVIEILEYDGEDYSTQEIITAIKTLTREEG